MWTIPLMWIWRKTAIACDVYTENTLGLHYGMLISALTTSDLEI